MRSVARPLRALLLAATVIGPVQAAMACAVPRDPQGPQDPRDPQGPQGPQPLVPVAGDEPAAAPVREVDWQRNLLRVTVQRVDRPALDAVQVVGVALEGDDGYAVTFAGALYGADRVIVQQVVGSAAESRPRRATIVGIDDGAGVGLLRIDRGEPEERIAATVRRSAPGDDPAPRTPAPEGRSGDEPEGKVRLLCLSLDGGLEVSEGELGGLVGRPVGRGGKNPVLRPLLRVTRDRSEARSRGAGGLVLDSEGELVGLLLPAGEEPGARFALPAPRLLDGVERLRKRAESCLLEEVPNDPAPPRAWVGIRGQEPDPALEAQLGREGGVVVLDVHESGPAFRAGLSRYDLLVGWDGASVKDLLQLQALVEECRPGQTVRVEFVREGRTRACTLVLGGW